MVGVYKGLMKMVCWLADGGGSHPCLSSRAGPVLQGHATELERGGQEAEKTK